MQRTLIAASGGFLGAVIGVAIGIAMMFGYVYLHSNDYDNGASGVMLVIVTAPSGLLMGAWYGAKGALRLWDRQDPHAPKPPSAAD